MRYLRVVSIVVLLTVAPTCHVFADDQIVFYSDREGGTPGGYIDLSVFVMNPDGSNLVNLSKEIGVDILPSVSPDKTKYLFCSGPNWKHHIFMIDTDGSNLLNLTDGPEIDHRPRWSPDGTQILWSRSPPNGVGGSRDIFVMNADGSNKRNLGMGSDPAWSPDGTQIAFSLPINAGPNANFADIHVMNADGADRRRVSNAVTTDHSPSWSPDGTKIAFIGINDWSGHRHVYVVNVDGSHLVDLTKDFAFAGGLSWSPYGTKIAFVAREDIYVVNVDGTDTVNLTGRHQPGRNSYSRWSPDGTEIVFQTDRDGNQEVYVMNADGSNPVNLTNHSARDRRPNWYTIDFTAVAPQDKLITTWGQIKRGNQ